MDQNGVGHRHRRTPSADRFIGVFSPPSSVAATSPVVAGDELNEVDVFYATEFPEPRISGGGGGGASYTVNNHRFRHSFRQQEKFGILAALPEDHRNSDGGIVQKPAVSSSPTSSFRDIPSIPKPSDVKYTQSMPIRRFQQSAPVNVPMMPRKGRKLGIDEVEADDDDVDDEEVLPPHEMVARGSLRNQKTTLSVLEGVGRTLKGRDLRQVRNAVWRQTGFLD